MVNIKSKSDNCFSKYRPMHSPDKLTALLQQSQARHINRIRFGIEKRKRKESGQFNYGQPEKSNNRSPNVRTTNSTYPRSFPNKNELIQFRLGVDRETKRFSTSDTNNLFYKSSEHSGDKGDGFDDASNIQDGTQVILTSYKTSSVCTKKSRKQWVKTNRPALIVKVTSEENTSDRSGYKKTPSVENNWQFNSIQNGRNIQSLEYVFKKSPTATEKMASVARWIERLPLPESGEPILESVPYGIFEERAEEVHQSSGEGIVTKHDDLAKDLMSIDRDAASHRSSGENIKSKDGVFVKDLISIGEDVEEHQSLAKNIITTQGASAGNLISIGRDVEEHQSLAENITKRDNPAKDLLNIRRHVDTKNAKKSQRKIAKQMVNASGLTETRSKEYKDRKERKKILSKKENPSNRIGLKTTKDDPLKVAYTPSGKLKIIICLKSLKEEKNLSGKTLLVWLRNFQHSAAKNTTTSRKLEKGFRYLNDQQMECFENIFKNKNTNGS